MLELESGNGATSFTLRLPAAPAERFHGKTRDPVAAE
jgi:hypothetical protein